MPEFDLYMTELEEAAKVLLAPPHLVTDRQREAATELFANFKRIKYAYGLCRYIMDNCKIDYVVFEVADAVRQGLIREWKLLPKRDINSLLEYLLEYVAGRVATLPVFVREKIIKVIATIIKRGSLEDEGVQRGALFNEIENMVWFGEYQKQVLGCCMMATILVEHSVTPKSCEIGLTMKQNIQVKEQFEMTDLKRVFVFCIKALCNVTMVEGPLTEQNENIVKQLLCLSELVLSWNYTVPTRLFCTPSTEPVIYPKLKLSREWKDVVVDNKVVNLYFTVYWKVRSNPQLAHHGLMCLVQFATLQGPIFLNQEERCAYITTFIEGFLKLIQSATVLDREAIGVASMAREVMAVLPDVIEPDARPPMLQSFLQQLTLLTCSFAEGAAREESLRYHDKLYMEAFDNMMDSWLNALNTQTDPWIRYIRVAALRIFDAYVKCHLAPPDGSRGERGNEPEVYEESDEPDRIKFRDQLQSIGECGRQCAEFSLPLLANLIDQRIKTLTQHRKFLKTFGCAQAESIQFFNVYEDLNWLLLIAGNVLSYGTTEIPADLMKYSVAQTRYVSLDTTQLVFCCPDIAVSDLPFGGRDADHVVRLISSGIRLTVELKHFINNKIARVLSPELVCSTMWYLKRFATTYLMFNEHITPDISLPFVETFGRDSEGGIRGLNFMFDSALVFLNNLDSEPDVVEECLDLFMALVDNKEKAQFVLSSRHLNTLMEMLPNLKFGVKRDIMKGLTLAGVGLDDYVSDNLYWLETLKPLRDRLQAVMNREDFKTCFHNEQVKAEVIDVLDCFTGVAMGSAPITMPAIFHHMSPILTAMPTLMRTYHNYQQVVELILMALVKAANHFISYLPHSQSKTLYEASALTIQEYSKLNSRRLTLDSTSEEDCFTDLLLILELLSNLFTKEIFDFSRAENNEPLERPVIVADVCLFGLNQIMPLIKSELLSFPELSLQYYKLISYVCQFYPGKIVALEERLLHCVLRSVEFGLKSTNEEVIPYCCDFVHFLALHLRTQTEQGEANPILKPLLKLLLNMCMTHQVTDWHLPKASSALFALICCYEGEYVKLRESIIESQANDAVRELVTNAFKNLMEEVPLRCHRQYQNLFRRNLETFVVEVRGFFDG